jgi:colicin import membrane protein
MAKLKETNYSKSNLISLILHLLVIWAALSLKSAHILTPSRSDGMEVSLISSSEIPQPQLAPAPTPNSKPTVTEVTTVDNSAEIKIKPPEKKPLVVVAEKPVAKIIPTQPKLKPQPQKIQAKKPNKAITNQLLSQLGMPTQTGTSRGKATGGTKTGTANSNVLLHNYGDLVIERVRPYVDVPEGIDPNTTAIVKVTLLPNMQVYKVELSQASGNVAYDNSVQDAIKKVGVFPPLPPDAKFVDFRVLYLTFKPE